MTHFSSSSCKDSQEASCGVNASFFVSTGVSIVIQDLEIIVLQISQGLLTYKIKTVAQFLALKNIWKPLVTENNGRWNFWQFGRMTSKK